MKQSEQDMNARGRATATNDVIGKPLSRLDGRPKVTGAARYTADTPIEGLTYAVFATSTIPHGRVTKLDVSKAEVAPGVLKVLTHLNTPKLKPVQHPPAGQNLMPLQDDRILYEGQPVALVIADTWERARHARAGSCSSQTPRRSILRWACQPYSALRPSLSACRPAGSAVSRSLCSCP